MLENLKQNVVPHNCCWKRRVYITHWGSTEHKNALRSSPSLWIIKVLGRENYNKLEWNYSFTVTGQDDILILGVFCAATNIWCSARVPLSLLQSWERCLSSPLSGLQLMLIAWIHFQPRYVWDDKADNCSDHTTDQFPYGWFSPQCDGAARAGLHLPVGLTKQQPARLLQPLPSRYPSHYWISHFTWFCASAVAFVFIPVQWLGILFFCQL